VTFCELQKKGFYELKNNILGRNARHKDALDAAYATDVARSVVRVSVCVLVTLV